MGWLILKVSGKMGGSMEPMESPLDLPLPWSKPSLTSFHYTIQIATSVIMSLGFSVPNLHVVVGVQLSVRNLLVSHVLHTTMRMGGSEVIFTHLYQV